MAIEGIEKERAQLILGHRSKYGRFEDWDDFANIEGIGDALVSKAPQVARLGKATAQRTAAKSGDGDRKSHA